MKCARCQDVGWVCERHDDKPWEHDGCPDAGMTCPDCNVASEDNPPRPPALRSPMRRGVRWRVNAHEGALLALAGAIIGAVQKADGAIPPRDRRALLSFVRTLSRVGPRGRSAVGRARAAWQRIPAALRHQIAELAATAGCADELQRVTGKAAVLRSDS
jgi:hypothetical protein